MRRWRVAGVVLLVVLAGCSFFDRYPDNDLAEERLQEIEADPGFSFVPRGAVLDGVFSTRQCADEGADWSGLFTERVYRTSGSSLDAYAALVAELEDVGWTVTPVAVASGREAPLAEAAISRSFDGWVADGRVQAPNADEVRIDAGPDEGGVCYAD